MPRFSKLHPVRSSVVPTRGWTPRSVTRSDARESSDCSCGRVAKILQPSTSSSSSLRKISSSSSENIAALIDEHRERVREESEARLRQDQDALGKTVDGLRADVQRQIELLHDAERPVLQSMADEKLRIVERGHDHEHDQSEAEAREVVVELRDRVQDFEAFVREKEREVARLMAEWNETQMKIACMAVEVVGCLPDKVHANSSNALLDPEDQNIRTHEAMDKHNARQERHQDDVARIASVGAQVKELAQEMKKTARAQQRELRTSQNKKLKDLTVYLRGLTG